MAQWLHSKTWNSDSLSSSPVLATLYLCDLGGVPGSQSILYHNYSMWHTLRGMSSPSVPIVPIVPIVVCRSAAGCEGSSLSTALVLVEN